MKSPKYPEDFVGWKKLYKMHNTHYLILESPDGSMEACIHMVDYDVVGIKDKKTGKDLFDGNIVLAKKLGFKL